VTVGVGTGSCGAGGGCFCSGLAGVSGFSFGGGFGVFGGFVFGGSFDVGVDAGFCSGGVESPPGVGN